MLNIIPLMESFKTGKSIFQQINKKCKAKKFIINISGRDRNDQKQ